MVYFLSRRNIYIVSSALFIAVLQVNVAVLVVAKPSSSSELGVLQELHEQLEKSIQILLGTDTRLVRVDATKHTANEQTLFCPSALPIAMNAILNYANPDVTKPIYDTTSKYNTKDMEIKVLASAMEVCTLCITNNPTNRHIFSEGQNIEQSYNIHTSIVALLRIPALAAKASHLIWIATYTNAKNHFQFIAADAIHALSTVILNIPYPILTDTTTTTSTSATTSGSALSVMWAAAALQNLAASYCDNPDGTCGWEWFKHEHNDEERVEFEYVFELTEDSGNIVVDATEVRQAIASNTALIYRLLQWTCHGPVSGSMTMDNPFPGQNAMSIPEHESSMNIVPWAALGALSNVAIDLTVKEQLLEHYGDTMPCFCYMSQSPDWLEAVKGQYVLQHLRHDKDPCWFDIHDSGEGTEPEHVLCVDRVFTDIGGSTCTEYSDPTTLTEEDCLTPDIANDTLLASSTCCLCHGGDHYPRSSPINIHEADEEAIRAHQEAHEELAEVSEHEEDLPYEEMEEDEEEGEYDEEEIEQEL
jgi:hypothetical protein